MHLFRFLIKFCRQKAPQADAITKGAPPHRIQNIGYRIHDTRYRIQDTRYKIQNKIQDTKYKIQDTGYKIKGGSPVAAEFWADGRKHKLEKGSGIPPVPIFVDNYWRIENRTAQGGSGSS